MHKATNYLLLGIIFLSSLIFVSGINYTATITASDILGIQIEQGKSISYYLMTINSSILGSQTNTLKNTNLTASTGTNIIANNQTLTAECIENILTKYDSPAKNIGLGEKIITQAKLYKIDAGYALATFRVESSFGKNGEAFDNNSIGNRRDTSGNFIKYKTWEEGVADWFSYINRKYVSQNITTVETIVPIYAPSSENNTSKYITDITGFMAQHKGMC